MPENGSEGITQGGGLEKVSVGTPFFGLSTVGFSVSLPVTLP
ncbi:hypothetical protein HMPREF0294_0870 [Corynebacterium glucuronolyticum ATCC 51867]|nr:hypothetical protein HMPREF0294_0870 [Corynebacterium glucuronolyticum ATCC 51867]